MADGEYKLTELAELAGVPPRTIRFYIQRELLPGPRRGSQSRYTDEHLARLRVIRKLQDVPLPLDVIRETLNRLSSPVEESQSPEPPESKSGSREPSPGGADHPEHDLPASEAGAQGPADAALSYIKWAGAAAPALAKRLRRPTGSSSSMVEPSKWDHFALTADIDLLVRRPLPPSQKSGLRQLLEKARELFPEEPS